jgi:HEAT repeat protein
MVGLGVGRPEQALALRTGPPREALLESLAAAPDDLELLERLALCQDPDDHELLLEHRRHLGKRGDNHWLLALGQHGDPRSLPLLEGLLSEVGVDPGRGFARRRLSALALGRIGCPSSAGALVRALEVEALDHEGRPGAGLGVQYPVRGVLLWALGEVQARAQAALLAGYLGNLHSSALGGLYLPAMGALLKLGEAARPALERVAGESSDPEAVRNAEGVLGALAQ